VSNNCTDCETLWLGYTVARRTFMNLRRAALSAPSCEPEERAKVVRQVQHAETSLDEARAKLTEHMSRTHKSAAPV
jgi:hypothetical protein